VYGDDRVFVDVADAGATDNDRERALAALAAAGHPVIRITVPGPLELGAEFFRWEIATAAAAAELGINPFDQPDVEAAKLRTRALIRRYEEEGQLPEERPVAADATMALFTDGDRLAGDDVEQLLAAHLGQLGAGDYLAINAFLAMDPAIEAELQALRHAVRTQHRVATAFGFGPRYLHSTGQLHKGGPASGLFLVVTADPAIDIDIPGQKLSFGVLSLAQARGDHEALLERDRRSVRVHLRGDPLEGLRQLRALIERHHSN